MNLIIKLDDLNVVPLEEVTKRLDKKYDKMIFNDKINKIGEKINIDEIEFKLVSNVVPKPEEFDESSRRITHFMRPRYVSVGRTINFSFGFISRKTMSYEEIGLTPINQRGYILKHRWNS